MRSKAGTVVNNSKQSRGSDVVVQARLLVQARQLKHSKPKLQLPTSNASTLNAAPHVDEMPIIRRQDSKDCFSRIEEVGHQPQTIQQHPIAVVEPDGPAYIVVSEENVEIEKPWYCKRHIQAMLVVFAASIVAVVMVIGAVQKDADNADSEVSMPSFTPSASQIPTVVPSDLPTHIPSKTPSAVPSISPTTERYDLLRSSLIAEGVIDDDEQLDNIEESFAVTEAVNWFVYEDAFEFVLDNSSTSVLSIKAQVAQRFVLAVLYFATNGPNWRHGLADVWLSSRPICEWWVLDSETYKVGIVGCKDDAPTRIGFCKSKYLSSSILRVLF